MTIQEQKTKALEAARRDKLQVVAHGRRKTDGAAVCCVPSRTQPGRWHIVAVLSDRLECDCYASMHGRVCAHRACVHDFLAEGLRAALQDARDSALLLADNRPVGIFK